MKKYTFLLAIMLFVTACQSNVLGTMKKLNVNEYFSDPQAIALATAAVDGNTAKVKQLIAAGTPVDIQGRNGITPLWWVFINRGTKGLDMMEVLLKHEANPDATFTESDDRLLGWAAVNNEPDFIKLLVDYGADMYWINREYGRKFPVIVDSFTQKRYDNIKMFYQLGFDMNYKNYCDCPLVYEGMTASAYDMVIWMIEDLGVETNFYSKAGENLPAIAEVEYKRKHGKEKRQLKKIIELLKARGAKFPAISAPEYRKHHGITEVCL